MIYSARSRFADGAAGPARDARRSIDQNADSDGINTSGGGMMGVAIGGAAATGAGAAMVGLAGPA